MELTNFLKPLAIDDVSLADFLLAVQPKITKGVLILLVESRNLDGESKIMSVM